MLRHVVLVISEILEIIKWEGGKKIEGAVWLRQYYITVNCQIIYGTKFLTLWFWTNFEALNEHKLHIK